MIFPYMHSGVLKGHLSTEIPVFESGLYDVAYVRSVRVRT